MCYSTGARILSSRHRCQSVGHVCMSPFVSTDLPRQLVPADQRIARAMSLGEHSLTGLDGLGKPNHGRQNEYLEQCSMRDSQL